jgi:hypothetical protein
MAQSKSDLLREIKKLQQEIIDLDKKSTSLTEDEIRAQERLKNAIVRKAREVKKINKEQLAAQQSLVSGISQQEVGLKSLTGMYTPIKEIEKQRVKALGESNIRSQHNVEVLGRAQAINEKIANLTSDDIVQRQALNMELEQELGSLRGRGAALDYQKSLLMESNKLANQYAGLTDKQKEFLEKQISVYQGIQDAIGGVLETASLLTKTTGGMFGIALIGAGKFVGKLGEVRSELGGITEFGTTALSFIDSNAVSNAKELASQFGGIDNVSGSLQASTSLISANMGISGTEAAGLLGTFSRLNGNSESVALDMTKTTQEFAKQNGVIPSQVMGDLAGATEEFALYGKEGGKNLIQAAVAARKMGVELKTMTGITDNLLDFETSITKELELGAMLGKNINLDRARGLAFAGKTTEAVEETLKALGGVEAFNKMDPFAKKAAADLLGVQVSELDKMVKLQGESVGEVANLNEEFSMANEAVNAGLNKYLGTSLQGIGGMVIGMGQMNAGLSSIGLGFKDVAKSIGGGLKKLLMWPVNKIKGAFNLGGADTPDAKPKATAKTSKGGGFMDSIGKMDMKKMIQGAAAILILSAALFVAAKAFQEFGSVTWPAVAMGLVGLAGLAAIAYVLGKAQGEMIKGAIAVAILGAALIPFAFSMSLIAGLDIGSVMAAAAGLVIFSAAIFGLGALMMTGVGAFIFGAGLLALVGLGVSMMALGAGLLVAAAGFQAIGGSMGSVVSLISQVKDVLGGMFQYIAPIAALSLALVGLAGALTMVGFAGIAALPGLMAVAAVGTIAMGVGSLLGIGEEGGTAAGGDSDLLNEIRGLRADLNNGKVAVYLDGQKVTAGVSRVVSRVGTNSYSAG